MPNDQNTRRMMCSCAKWSLHPYIIWSFKTWTKPPINSSLSQLKTITSAPQNRFVGESLTTTAPQPLRSATCKLACKAYWITFASQLYPLIAFIVHRILSAPKNPSLDCPPDLTALSSAQQKYISNASHSALFHSRSRQLLLISVLQRTAADL